MPGKLKCVMGTLASFPTRSSASGSKRRVERRALEIEAHGLSRALAYQLIATPMLWLATEPACQPS